MTTAWNISATAERVALDAQGRAETTFTVTNSGPVDQRVVVDVVPGERADRAWFTVDEPQRIVPPGGSASFLARIAAPAGAAPGQYWLAGRAYSGDTAPEETSVLSDRVLFEVRPSVAPARRNPLLWLIPVGVLLAAIVGTVLFLVLRDDGEPDAAPSTAPGPVVQQLSVHKSDRLVVDEIFSADLDEVRLATSDADGDLYFEWVSNEERYLTPLNGATLAAIGTSDDALQACADAAKNAERIPAESLAANDVVCVLTDQGRLSVLTLEEAIGPSPAQLKAAVITYQS